MRHRKAGRQLRRTGEQKLALMRSLAMSLIQHGAIETTEAKAKELRPFVERLITKAKTGTLHNRRLAARHVQQRAIADKLFQDVGPKFATRATWRLGFQMRRVRLFAWETLFPNATPLSHTKQRLRLMDI